MTLDELLNTVRNSAPDDWESIERHPIGQAEPGHVYHAAYRADLRVGLVWGLVAAERFEEEWATGFSDPHAERHFVDFLYSGAVVHRESVVLVDGGRGYLPLTVSPRGRSVTPEGRNLARLIDGLVNGANSRFDEFFDRAALRVE